MNDRKPDSESLHQEACQLQKDFYIDPKTGYQVFTSYYHLKRGHCCGSGCRHCPWKKISQKPAKNSTDSR